MKNGNVVYSSPDGWEGYWNIKNNTIEIYVEIHGQDSTEILSNFTMTYEIIEIDDHKMITSVYENGKPYYEKPITLWKL